MRYGLILGVFLTLLFFSTASRSDDLVYPNPDIAPVEVIGIQLKGLQYNDTPEADAGIRQTLSLIHI